MAEKQPPPDSSYDPNSEVDPESAPPLDNAPPKRQIKPLKGAPDDLPLEKTEPQRNLASTPDVLDAHAVHAVPPKAIGDDPEDRAARNYIQGHVRRGDQLDAAFRLAKSNEFSALFAREIDRHFQQDGPKLSPQELNDLYPDLTEKFNTSYTREEADAIVAHYDEQQKLQRIIQAGPTGIASTLGNIGASLLAGVTDPLSLAANIGLGFGIGSVAGRLGAGAYAMTAAERAARPISQVITQTFMENLAIQSALEPAHQYLSRNELEEQRATDVFKSVVLSSAGFTALHVGFHVLAGYLPKSAETVAHESAVAQLMQDKKPNVEPILDASVDPMRGTPKGAYEGVRQQYEFKPLSDEGVKDRGFYHGTASVISDITKSDKIGVGEDLGSGLYLTDNPNVANGVSGAQGSQSGGVVFRAGIENAKLINLDLPFSKDVAEIIKQPLIETLGRDRANILFKEKPTPNLEFAGNAADRRSKARAQTPQLTGQDILDRVRAGINDGTLPPETLNDFVHLLSEAGYDGYRHTSGYHYDLDPQNVVMLFDTSDAVKTGKLQAHDVVPADQSVTPVPPEHAVRMFAEDQQSYASNFDHDPKEFRQFEESQMRPKPEPTPDFIRKSEDEAVLSLDQMAEQGHLLPEEVKTLEAIKEARAEHERFEKTMRAAASCVGGLQ